MQDLLLEEFTVNRTVNVCYIEACALASFFFPHVIDINQKLHLFCRLWAEGWFLNKRLGLVQNDRLSILSFDIKFFDICRSKEEVTPEAYDKNEIASILLRLETRWMTVSRAPKHRGGKWTSFRPSLNRTNHLSSFILSFDWLQQLSGQNTLRPPESVVS